MLSEIVRRALEEDLHPLINRKRAEFDWLERRLNDWGAQPLEGEAVSATLFHALLDYERHNGKTPTAEGLKSWVELNTYKDKAFIEGALERVRHELGNLKTWVESNK